MSFKPNLNGTVGARCPLVARRAPGKRSVGIVGAVLCLAGLTCRVSAQTVIIQNISYPGTGLEVGDTVGVSISGAPAYGTVTADINGTLYSEGTTDGGGNWSATDNVTSSFANTIWTETWYVNGTEVPPLNVNTTDLPHAPTLPTFEYYANYTSSNCGGQSTNADNCGGAIPEHWVFTPVGYFSDSTLLTSSDVSSAAASWNSIQSQISLVSSSVPAVVIYDNPGMGPDLAYTYSYGWDCASACYNYTDLCGGLCFNK